MAIRSFRDTEGQEWNVWLVRPAAGESSPLTARFRDGWLCFQQADGEQRSRLPASEIPANWEALSDDRLDLLRRVAEQPATVRASVGPTEERRQATAEDADRPLVTPPSSRAYGDDPTRA